MSEARAREERWVGYYAFVPGSQEPANTRGEAENFLHDLTTNLERAGIRSGGTRSDFDRQQLLHRLNEQLHLPGEDYASHGRRWVILIDGLDHASREQRVDRSLLNDLPDPTRLQEGVVVLLGTQTLDLSDSNSVRAELRTPTAASRSSRSPAPSRKPSIRLTSRARDTVAEHRGPRRATLSVRRKHEMDRQRSRCSR
jgi:hypothetical protein